MRKDRKIVVIAGPNGAGKTTFANEFLPYEAGLMHFVNADLIAAGLSPYAPEKAAIRAGRIMLEMIHDFVKRKESFAFESTLSGRGYSRLIPEWQSAGYLVKLIYLSLYSEEMAVERVAVRVKQGGHFVPDQVIKRRFRSGMINFEEIYKKIVDIWVLYDNSPETPVLIASGVKMPEKKPKPIADKDIESSRKALFRASQKAREVAKKTGTPIVVFKNGRVEKEDVS